MPLALDFRPEGLTLLRAVGESATLTVLEEPVPDPSELCKDSLIWFISFWIDERTRLGVPGLVIFARPDRECEDEEPPADCCDHGVLSTNIDCGRFDLLAGVNGALSTRVLSDVCPGIAERSGPKESFPLGVGD
jgi:hypothetical protein